LVDLLNIILNNLTLNKMCSYCDCDYLTINNRNTNISFITDNHLRTTKNAYENDILGGAYSENLMMIATFARDSEIRFWEFERGYYKGSLPLPATNIEFL